MLAEVSRSKEYSVLPVGLYCGLDGGSRAVDGARLRAPETVLAERLYARDRQARSPMLGSIFGKLRLALD